jgi:hypothetical protein
VHAGQRRAQAGLERVAQRGDPRGVGERIGQPLERRGEADDRGQVFGAAAPVPLLAAGKLRRERHAVAHEQRADPFRPVQLVRGQRHRVGAERREIERQLADQLRRVDVQQRAAACASAFTSAIGISTPVSLFAAITDTSATSGPITRAALSRSSTPSGRTAMKSTGRPWAASACASFSCAACSVAPKTSLRRTAEAVADAPSPSTAR